MSRTPDQHLTEAELDEALIGGVLDLPEDAQQHLAACDHCQAEFAAISDPIASFNEVSLAWSERRASTLPLRPPVEELEAVAEPRWRRLVARRPLAFAGTATAGLVMGLLLIPRHQPVESTAAHTPLRSLPATTDFSPARNARIARDNQMLSEINRALEGSDDVPATGSDLQPVRSTHGATSHGVDLTD